MNQPTNLLTVGVHTDDSLFHVAWITIVDGGITCQCPACGKQSSAVVPMSGQHNGVDVTLDELREIWQELSADLYELALKTLVLDEIMVFGSIWSMPIEGGGWWIGVSGTAFIMDAEELESTMSSLEMLITKATRHGFSSFDGAHDHAELPENLRAELSSLDLETL